MTDTITGTAGSQPPRGLAPARVLWIILALIYFAVFAAAVPYSVATYQEPCRGGDCVAYQLTAQELALLQDLGISNTGYANFVAVSEALLLTWAALGILIYLRRSHDWIGLLVSMALIAVGINGVSDNVSILSARTAALAPLYNSLSAIGSALIILLVFLFPDGSFVPGWARYVAFPLTLIALADPLLVSVIPGMEGPPGTLAQLTALLTGLVVGGATQIHRYRNHSDVEQRQQTKWVLFGFLALIVVAVTWTISTQVIPPAPGRRRLYFFLISGPIAWLLLMMLPISMTFSILRYRLFEIDIIIKRTLVYGALTVSVLGLYFAAVLSLQALFRTVIGQDNQLAIVASTLLIAALFNPLRRRIQVSVNRRFFRADYDAAQTLSTFGESVRDEVDLASMQSELLDTVQQTMHPRYVSLWLRRDAGNLARDQ